MPILTARREKFAQHYFAHRDPSEAYKAAYGVRADTKASSIQTAGSKLRAEPDISQRLDELQAAAMSVTPSVFDAAAALEAWLEIAQANPDELIGLRVGACRRCWGVDHQFQWKEFEYVEALAEYERLERLGDKTAVWPDLAGGFGYRFSADPHPDCPGCEGEGKERVVARDTSKLSPAARALYGGVKQTRNGTEIVIADRQKALENATRMIGAFNDKLRLDGSIAAMLGIVRLQSVDPQEASREYIRLMSANAA